MLISMPRNISFLFLLNLIHSLLEFLFDRSTPHRFHFSSRSVYDFFVMLGSFSCCVQSWFFIFRRRLSNPAHLLFYEYLILPALEYHSHICDGTSFPSFSTWSGSTQDHLEDQWHPIWSLAPRLLVAYWQVAIAAALVFVLQSLPLLFFDSKPSLPRFSPEISHLSRSSFLETPTYRKPSLNLFVHPLAISVT